MLQRVAGNVAGDIHDGLVTDFRSQPIRRSTYIGNRAVGPERWPLLNVFPGSFQCCNRQRWIEMLRFSKREQNTSSVLCGQTEAQTSSRVSKVLRTGHCSAEWCALRPLRSCLWQPPKTASADRHSSIASSEFRCCASRVLGQHQCRKQEAAPKTINEEVGFLLRLLDDRGELIRVQLKRQKCLKLKVRQNVAKVYTVGEKAAVVVEAQRSNQPVFFRH